MIGLALDKKDDKGRDACYKSSPLSLALFGLRDSDVLASAPESGGTLAVKPQAHSGTLTRKEGHDPQTTDPVPPDRIEEEQ